MEPSRSLLQGAAKELNLSWDRDRYQVRASALWLPVFILVVIHRPGAKASAT